MKVVAATGNAHKLREMRAIFPAWEILSEGQAGFTGEVEETGETFAENALLKARAVSRATGLPALADDSGLCVDALGGAPGVETAYYAGPSATAAENRAKLLAALEGVPAEKRGAHFVCLLLLIAPDGSERVFEGKCEGVITRAEAGTGGFGYDPVFAPHGFSATFAELGAEEKDRLSHRGNAFARLAAFFGTGADAA